MNIRNSNVSSINFFFSCRFYCFGNISIGDCSKKKAERIKSEVVKEQEDDIIETVDDRVETNANQRVKVALTESIESLGKEGDLVEVAPGYARNFLLPYGKAMNVTPAVLKQIERKKEKEKIAADKLKQEALDFQTALSTIGRFTIKKQVGEDGVLFGTVTNGDVAEAIEAATKKEIDRRNITVPDIHNLGSFIAKIKLHPEVNAEVNIEVTS